MAVARCSVSFTDSDGVSHTAHVQAESLYEAGALAVGQKLIIAPIIPRNFGVPGCSDFCHSYRSGAVVRRARNINAREFLAIEVIEYVKR